MNPNNTQNQNPPAPTNQYTPPTGEQPAPYQENKTAKVVQEVAEVAATVGIIASIGNMIKGLFGKR